MPVTCHAFIATSLDGFIARPDGRIDWLEAFNAPGEDHGYDAFIAEMDGIIMGRGTYETVLGFGQWPYSLPVIVMSQSLGVESIPDALADMIAICDMEPEALVAALSEEGWQKVYVDGGQVLQSFIRAGLLSDITLTQVPVLIGEGRPLFGTLPADVRLEHQGCVSFASGLVKTKYRLVGR
ncbi:MAG: dihydrofolate reductase family protein [Pseudorhodobacter sp.]